MKLYRLAAIACFALFPVISYAQIEDEADDFMEEEIEVDYDDTGFNLDAVIRDIKGSRIRKYPARLWEITGNGLKKPSYLYGTMHVSKKLAFNLGDTFYKAISSVDVVALELAIDSWVSNIGKNQGRANSQRRDQAYKEYNYKTALRFPKFDLEPIVGQISNGDYMSNFLLYRQGYGSADYSEKTYVDLYIHQLGKKMGKFCTGLEDFDESDRMVNRSDWKNRTVKRENRYRRGYYGGYGEEDPVEKAYREGDLDLIDSLDRKSNKNPIYHKWMLDVRNRVMANSIHKTVKDKSIFAAVGCAHLPGDSGVIDMLRGMGYTLTPIRDNVGDYAFKQKLKLDNMNYPVDLKTFKSQTGELEISLPGEPISRESRNQEELFYADVSNGAYYVIKKIPYYGTLNKISSNELIRQIDSALYENVPGDITSKQKTKIDGFPALLVENKTKSGESQRHAFIALENYVWYVKINGSGEYAFSKDVAKVIKSIKITAPKQNWNAYSPQSGGYEIQWPVNVILPKYTFDTSAAFKPHMNIEHSTSDEFYFLYKISAYNGDAYGDSFHFPEMVSNLAFYSEYKVDKTNFKKIDKRLCYLATLKAKEKGKGYIHLLLAPYGNEYIYAGVYTKDKNCPNDFLSSFKYTPAKYKYLPALYTETESGMTYKTNNAHLFKYYYKYKKEEQALLKKDLVYPEKYSSASYLWSDDLEDNSRHYDYVNMPNIGAVSISYYRDNKMAPEAYTPILRSIMNKSGDLYANYKSYKDSVEKAELKDKKKRYTYEVSDLKIKYLDTIYKLDGKFYIDALNGQRGSNVRVFNREIITPHQFVSIGHVYSAIDGIHPVALDIINSVKINNDKLTRLDSHSLADLLFKLMISKDSVDQFKLDDYSNYIFKIPSNRNKDLFAQMVKFGQSTGIIEKDLFETIEAKLRKDKYLELKDYYLGRYIKAGDTSDLQVKYLDKLANLQNQEALDTMIYWLMEETPLKPENSYNSYIYSGLIYDGFDSLKLWTKHYSNLLALRRYDEYREAVLTMGQRLIDSSLASHEIFKPILNDLILSFRDDLKRKTSVKSKNSYYDDDENDKFEAKDYRGSDYGNYSNKLYSNNPSVGLSDEATDDYDYEGDEVENAFDYSGDYSDDEGQTKSELAERAQLLMNFYNTNPAVKKRLTKALQIPNIYQRMEFIEVIMKGKGEIPDSMHKYYLAKQDYKFGYAKLLHDNKKDKLIPKNMTKEEEYVKNFAYYTRWNSSDTVVFIGKRKANIESEKGQVYFYKQRSKKPKYDGEQPEWKSSYVWVGEKDTLSNFSKPRLYSFNDEIPKKITFNELMDNTVFQIENWEHPFWMPLTPEDEEKEDY